MSIKHIITDGTASAEVYEHGATLTSWKVDGIEQIFVSEKAILDGSKAIRGGIPLVFPHFGKVETSKLPQHGFARNSKWVVIDQSKKNQIILQLLPENVPEELRSLWPNQFKLIYTVTLEGKALTTKLDVLNTENKNDGKAWEFTVLLHTYFKVPSIETTYVSGLKGLKYTEKINNILDKIEDNENIVISKEVDRVYNDIPKTITIKKEDSKSKIELNPTNTFKDVVVWNPWIEKSKGMSDFDDLEYKKMICVEIGTVSNFINLKPGENWTGSQTLTAKL